VSDQLLDRVSAVFLDVLGTAPARGAQTVPDDVEGWDSLGHIRLVHALEQEFACLFDDEALLVGVPLGALVTAIRAGAAA
jgi:acyl carrier protein